MSVTAVLVAAGSGSRLGADVPKAFVEVGGRTLLEHAVARFAAHPEVRDVVVAAPAELVGSAAELVPSARVVPGGATRQESVARGLAALAPDVDAVLVHDVARAFVPAAVIDRVLVALSSGAVAVVPTVPVADTIRSVDGGVLGGVVDRSRLAAVQTPQGFARTVLVAAHRAAVDPGATDDASLVEATGVAVVAVPGAPEAFKITVPLDLALAGLVADRD
jgi:2-C-methyl-D-erythritol 4-phosphate cytidylyltransferase